MVSSSARVRWRITSALPNNSTGSMFPCSRCFGIHLARDLPFGAPVEREAGDAAFAEQRHEVMAAAHEQQRGHFARVELRGDALQGGQREVAIFIRRQQPAPGIEQLHGIGAGIHLGQQQIRDHVGDGVERALRERRIAMHERARFAEILAAAAFDAVGEQRERRARESQDAVAILERLL